MIARPRVVVTQRIHQEIADLLSAETDLVINNSTESWSRAETIEHASRAEALMVFMPDFVDRDFLDRCAHLKVIAAALKGYDNFDVSACTDRGVWFTIVPDLLTEATAELTLGLMLALGRNVMPGDRLIREGVYSGWRPVLYGTGVSGATVGIIGFGNVGQALARLLQPFGCRLLYFDPAAPSSALAKSASLEQLLAESDFVVPLLPLTAETFHLFDNARLRTMKPTAFLINVGRGSVVDEEAVADALESGRLAGYAADVFEMEDWARSDRPKSVSARLLAIKDRTVFTPHLGSAVDSVRLEIERRATLNILAVLRGEHPPDGINRPRSPESLH